MKKIIIVPMCMLLISIAPFTVSAGNEETPEIEDKTGDARPYLDVEKIWFREEEHKPYFLYVTMKLNNPSQIAPKQHLYVKWMMNGEYYSSGLTIGYGFNNWMIYSSIEGLTSFGEKYNQTKITGSFNKEEKIIVCKIPKSAIGDPKIGDVLTHTHAQCFQRFGLWGRLGFSPKFREIIFLIFDLPALKVLDSAPDILQDGTCGYGKDYVVKY